VTSGPPVCLASASRLYNLPPAILWAVLDTEGGEIGQAVRDHNGTYDIGPMQINSSWLPLLRDSFGIGPYELAYDPCLNVATGAWILKRYMLESGDVWRGIARYHSGNPRLGLPYALRVWTRVLRNVSYAQAHGRQR
jgi:soluble lytic murein transglycosylase-like protein